MKLLSCAFNMDTNCVELKFADGSMIYIEYVPALRAGLPDL